MSQLLKNICNFLSSSSSGAFHYMKPAQDSSLVIHLWKSQLPTAFANFPNPKDSKAGSGGGERVSCFILARRGAGLDRGVVMAMMKSERNN